MKSIYKALLSSSTHKTLTKRRIIPSYITTQIQTQTQTHAYSTKKSTASTPPYRTTKYPPSAKRSPSPSPQPSPSTKEWKRPTLIPYQPKIVNSVHLIGYVHSPVLTFNSVCTDDGRHSFSAFTVLSHNKRSNSLRIPILFEDDLAHVAACHLKKNDYIYISGHLTPLHSPFDGYQGEATFQVVVQNIFFVEKPDKTKNISATDEQEEAANESEIIEDDVSSSWKDLISKPNEWWDIRLREGTPEGAAFERKSTGEVLVIDESIPQWIQHEVESIACHPKPLPASKKGTDFSCNVTKAFASELDHWRELVDNPRQWWDYRSIKLSGSVKPKHPDFKNKDTGIALWLNNAPSWVSPKLEGLEFDLKVVRTGEQRVKKGEESWKALIENPDKWWDNRITKRNEKAPDFKHKDTGEVLWLDGSPAWVQEKLPPPKAKQGADAWGGKQLSGAI